jgi:hypothetical protein
MTGHMTASRSVPDLLSGQRAGSGTASGIRAIRSFSARRGFGPRSTSRFVRCLATSETFRTPGGGSCRDCNSVRGCLDHRSWGSSPGGLCAGNRGRKRYPGSSSPESDTSGTGADLPRFSRTVPAGKRSLLRWVAPAGDQALGRAGMQRSRAFSLRSGGLPRSKAGSRIVGSSDAGRRALRRSHMAWAVVSVSHPQPNIVGEKVF